MSSEEYYRLLISMPKTVPACLNDGRAGVTKIFLSFFCLLRPDRSWERSFDARDPADAMRAWPTSPRVNSPRNSDPDLILPSGLRFGQAPEFSD
jgi:hypothetical protein